MGKLVVITGAGGGVGNAAVHQFADAGWTVVATARSDDDLDELRRQGIRCVRLDVCDDATIRMLAKSIGDRPLGALIHAAAVSHTGPAAEATRDMWNLMIQTNVIGPAMVTGALIDNLRKAQGTVVFISSGAGERGVPLHAVYSASKHALRGYADTLRMEEAGNGVRVSMIYPGQIDTGMLRTIDAEMGVPYTADKCIRPETVARVIRFVADASDDVHITNMDLRPRQEFSPMFNV